MNELLNYLGYEYTYNMGIRSLRPEEQKKWQADYLRLADISIHSPIPPAYFSYQKITHLWRYEVAVLG